jgi:hypothetical protein
MANFMRLSNGYPRSFAESSSFTIYDQEVTLASTLTTGTSYTLPTSGTYSSTELQVYLNGQRLAPTTDYSYVGSIPRSQVSFTFDLLIGDKLRFYVDRAL